MVDETSRLGVEIDEEDAVRDINRVTRAFARMQAAASSVGTGFTRMASMSSSAFSRLRSVAGRAFTVLGAGFRALRRTISLFGNAFRTLTKIVVAGGAIFTLFARNITQTGNEINKFVNTLIILKGSTQEAVEELEFLFNMSNRLGTSFTAAATPFTKFAAAAAGTISDQSIRDVFEAFSTVGVALQLTKSEVTGVFLALQQIASKGVVSMEELRLQLAERIPGAMIIAAQSMDMSLREFEEAVRDRTINAGVFLENFAESLQGTYQFAAEVASERLFADIQRLENQFVSFRQRIFESGFEEGLRTLVQSATEFFENNPELATTLGQFSQAVFERVASLLDSLDSETVVSFINQLIGAFEAIINALNNLALTLRRFFDDELDSSLDNIENKMEDFNKLVAERDEKIREYQTGRQQVGANAQGILGEMGVEVDASPNRLRESGEDIRRISYELFERRQELDQLIAKVEETGVRIADLPDDLLLQLPDVSLRAPEISIPRVESTGEPTRFAPRNQPVQPARATGAQMAAIERATRQSTILMPEFFDKLSGGELLRDMEDLDRVTHQYNVTVETQRLLMEDITELHSELDRLRAVPNMEADAQALNTTTLKLEQTTEKYLELEKQRIDLKERQLELMDEEKDKLSKIKTFQEQLEETFTSTRDVFINAIKKTEDAIVDMVAKGKASFSDLANAIIADLVRMATQAFLTRYVFGPLLGNFADSVGNALGGTFAQPGGSGSGGFGGIHEVHTGGVVGEDTLRSRSMFDRLKSSERPIIVETGEGVFTKEQMANMAPVSAIKSAMSGTRHTSPAAQAPIVNVRPQGARVEIINNTSEEPQVETEVLPDGTELTRVIIGTVAQDIASDGQITRLMRGKFGLRNTTSRR